MQIKKLVKYLSATMILVVVINNPMGVKAAESNYRDTREHWAKDTIQTWTDYDIVKGYKGEFRPNDHMTRGEVAAVVDRIFKYVKLSETAFTDLDNNVHANSLLKLHNKKVINGYPDGTVRPQGYITREEMVAVLNNIFKFEYSTMTEGSNFFTDQLDIAPWAKNSVLIFAQKGYVNGDHKKAFNPKTHVTRAEVVTMINNVVGDLYNTPQTYTDNQGKISIINTPQVTLKDMTLKEQLIISEGVGDGDVILDTIKTTEDILIKGGGENSIIIRGDSDIKKIITWKEESGVRIVIESGANVETFYVADGSDQVIITGKVDTVVIDSSSNNILFKEAEIKNLIVSGKGTNVEVDKMTKVDTLLVGKTAMGTRIQVDGVVSKLISEADQTIVEGKGKVEKLDIKGEKGENKLDKQPSPGPANPVEPKPPVDPPKPVDPPRPGYYDMVILVDGRGHVTVETVEDPRPPVEPPQPPIGQKPNVIIVIDGKGRVLAELVQEEEPDIPLPEGRYEVKFDVEGKGNIIIEKIN